MYKDNPQHILIIGQGIAGTCAAWEAIRKGHKVTLLDRRSDDCASSTSSGLINPITGRHFVKSWRVEEFILAARDIYSDIAGSLGVNVINDVEIVRHLSEINVENTWNTKAALEHYEKYMEMGPDRTLYNDVLEDVRALGTVKKVMRIEAGVLISHLRKRWIEEGILREETFDPLHLEMLTDKVTYKGTDYDQAILAMGWRGMNTIFETDVYRPVKGEVLIAEIPGFPEERIVKFGKFLVPIGQQRFWIGSTYQWEWENESSDEEKSQELEQFLREEVKLPYKILERKAGVRPATKYRRPLIGRLPDSPVYLFNGLGTKGVSMAPFWAQEIIKHISTNQSNTAITEAFGRVWPED